VCLQFAQEYCSFLLTPKFLQENADNNNNNNNNNNELQQCYVSSARSAGAAADLAASRKEAK